MQDSMDDLLRKYDTDGSISNLMEMERENPTAMFEPEQRAQLQSGIEDVRCDVCVAAAKVAANRAKKRKLLRDEDALSDMVSLLCYETPPERHASRLLFHARVEHREAATRSRPRRPSACLRAYQCQPRARTR